MDHDDALTLVRTLTQPVLELFSRRSWMISKTILPPGL